MTAVTKARIVKATFIVLIYLCFDLEGVFLGVKWGWIGLITVMAEYVAIGCILLSAGLLLDKPLKEKAVKKKIPMTWWDYVWGMPLYAVIVTAMCVGIVVIWPYEVINDMTMAIELHHQRQQ